LKGQFADEARMNTAEATYATRLNEWLPPLPERNEPYTHVKALGREKEISPNCSTPCLRSVVEAS
jgi:hypothetical protein